MKPWTITWRKSKKDHRHYPRIVSPNGRTTWVAPRGYVAPSAAARACNRLCEQMAGAGFVVREPA